MSRIGHKHHKVARDMFSKILYISYRDAKDHIVPIKKARRPVRLFVQARKGEASNQAVETEPTLRMRALMSSRHGPIKKIHNALYRETQGRSPAVHSGYRRAVACDARSHISPS